MSYCNTCRKRMMNTQHQKTGVCWKCHNEKTYGKIQINDDFTYGKEQKKWGAKWLNTKVLLNQHKLVTKRLKVSKLLIFGVICGIIGSYYTYKYFKLGWEIINPNPNNKNMDVDHNTEVESYD